MTHSWKRRCGRSTIIASILFLIQRLALLSYINVGTAISTIVEDATSTSSISTQTSAAATDMLVAAWDSVSLTIEEMWVRDAKGAEKEMERQMLGLTGDGSMSMFMPTLAPIVAPNPISTMPPTVDNNPTIGPTIGNCLNGRTSEQYLLDTLAAITPSVDVLLNPATPQGQAFNFLLNDTLIDADDAICNYTTLPQRYGLGKRMLIQ